MIIISSKVHNNTIMTSSLVIIQRIVVALAEGHNDVVESALQILPLDKVDDSTADSLIAWFLQQAHQSNNIEGAQLVINTFNLKRANVDELPAITKLLLNTTLLRDVLQFAITSIPTRLAVTYYGDLLNSTNDLAAIKAANILDTIVPNMTYEHWQLLLATIDDFMDADVNDEQYDFHLPLFKAYIETKAAENNICVQRPAWINEYDSQPLTMCPKDFPSVKNAVILIINDMRSKKLIDSNEEPNIENLQNNIISQYSISTMIEKRELLNALLPNLSLYNDVAVFRELGPVNSQFTHHQELLAHSKCNKYGGCRMFTCTEFETITEQGDDYDIMDQHIIITDWFRGSCDKCLRRISKRHYAVRQPLLHGGWRGCYCSFECLEKILTNNHEAMMVGRIKEQLEVLNIRDR